MRSLCLQMSAYNISHGTINNTRTQREKEPNLRVCEICICLYIIVKKVCVHTFYE